jgi:hypothetical protein
VSGVSALDRLRRLHGDAVAEWLAATIGDRPALLEQLADDPATVQECWRLEQLRRAEHLAYVDADLDRYNAARAEHEGTAES